MEILVPISSEDSARETVRYAVSTYPDASITVFHVLPRNAPYANGGVHVQDAVMKSDRQYAEKLFETAIETADTYDGSVTTMTAVGGPVREIISHADESNTDHIVMGSCGRSGLLRFLYRNVTNGVVYRSPVSVTVVK